MTDTPTPSVVVLDPEEPEDVRVREGFNPDGSWFSPRKRRPAAFKRLQGLTAPEESTN